MKRSLPRVALVGRQNVGKSTLFNMLIGERRAVVSPIAGTTRDRTTAPVQWREREWMLIDTGGIEETPTSDLNAQSRTLAERVIENANVVCFVVDGQTGLTREDRAIARILRKSDKPVLLAVNKLDAPRLRAQIPPEIMRLGFSTIVLLSGKNGTGTGDLLDLIAERLSPPRSSLPTSETKIIILGRPNAGKSSLLNRILNEERVLVSAEPHTTRDPQDVQFTFEDHNYRLIDTAGIRRQANLRHQLAKTDLARIEQQSVRMAVEELSRADIAIIVLDIHEPITTQDRHILRLAMDAKVSIVLAGNKWDLIPNKTTTTVHRVEEDIRKELPFITWAPFLLVSAKTGMRVHDLLRLCKKMDTARRQRISTTDLKRFLDKVVTPRWPVRNTKGDPLLPRLLEQTQSAPPVFRIVIGKKQKLPIAYQRYLINALREHFHFLGAPLHLLVDKQYKS